ncbi:MAG: hypothetical protein AB7F36_11980 [Reyranellaceae bacterium]
MWTQLADKSIVDNQGKVIHFGPTRYLSDICLGDCCFICGTDSDASFSREHVLPDWVVRRYSLHQRGIELPNQASMRYARYTVPCCRDCNSLLGTHFEETISAKTEFGYSSFLDHIDTSTLAVLFDWMALIFLKTHLKDKSLRFHLDNRVDSAPISSGYDWESLQPIHSVARSFYSGCTVDRRTIGSLLILPVANTPELQEQFDFADLHVAQTAMMRLGDIGLIAVFNDAGLITQLLSPLLKRITGPVSTIQLRELMVEFAYQNLIVHPRPTYHFDASLSDKRSFIYATRPAKIDQASDPRIRGRLLSHALRELLPHFELPGVSREKTIEALEAGTITFLFDEQGKFITETTILNV